MLLSLQGAIGLFSGVIPIKDRLFVGENADIVMFSLHSVSILVFLLMIRMEIDQITTKNPVSTLYGISFMVVVMVAVFVSKFLLDHSIAGYTFTAVAVFLLTFLTGADIRVFLESKRVDQVQPGDKNCEENTNEDEKNTSDDGEEGESSDSLDEGIHSFMLGVKFSEFRRRSIFYWYFVGNVLNAAVLLPVCFMAILPEELKDCRVYLSVILMNILFTKNTVQCISSNRILTLVRKLCSKEEQRKRRKRRLINGQERIRRQSLGRIERSGTKEIKDVTLNEIVTTPLAPIEDVDD